MAKRPAKVRTMLLRRRSSIQGAASLVLRTLALLAMVALMVGFHWFEREGLKDQIDGHVSLTDVIYFTMISATTTGYGDIVPVTDKARLFDALVVTPVRVFFVLILAGTAYTFVIRRSWEKWLMARIQDRLTNHIVVAGFGITGSEAVDELIARGADPREMVVIDCSEEALARAEAMGCNVLHGDATRDKILQAVRIEEARALVVSGGRDDTSVLITLTARHLAPQLKISVAIRNEDNELLARQAGATTVINPVSFTGLLLAGSTQGEHIADYLADLASSDGRVRLSERTVRDDECGKPLTQLAEGLGVRIYRDGKPIGFWEPEAQSLRPGDRIIEILATEPQEREV